MKLTLIKSINDIQIGDSLVLIYNGLPYFILHISGWDEQTQSFTYRDEHNFTSSTTNHYPDSYSLCYIQHIYQFYRL